MERVWFGNGPYQPYDASEIPAGLSTEGYHLHYLGDGVTLYWDKVAMAKGPGDPATALNIHWAHSASGASQSSATPQTEKRPLEGRIWYNYPGQSAPNREGALGKPSAIGRVLDDGTSQVRRYEYNSNGRMTKVTDPVGRETVYEYDANGIDLVRVKQRNGTDYDLLETRTYNSQHLPLTVTDAAGQTTTYTYNAAGQVLTATNAKNETTTYEYDANARLTSVTGPVTGSTTTYTYDGYNRVRTITDADNYIVTYDYDAADRLTKTTYPDGTFEEMVYKRLDPAERRDRLGRRTFTYHDANRRVVLTRDPLGRTITQQWCGCGARDALVDANGNRTRWERDAQARVTTEIRADGRETHYAYEAKTSRLKSITDPKQQVTTYSYFLDDKRKDTVYTNEQTATADISFTYDSVYGRVATMLDGTGTTTYAYHPITVPPAMGAAKLASVDGPVTSDTITYSYDEVGRVTTRAINGVGITWGFDSLGRMTTESNVLGTFTHTYDGATSRISAVTYPNGQTSEYAYYSNIGDHRLQTIHHKYPTDTTLSKFDYTYDAVGNIRTWRQQADTTGVTWDYSYDSADQLTSAINKATDPQQTILKRYAYAYDPAGNRTIEQIDDLVAGATYNDVNELVSQQPAGAMLFVGNVSEPSSVTIGDAAATVTAANVFQSTVPIVAGSNTVTIAATDAAGNIATQQYEISNSGATKTFTYDANGNLTADGTRTFEWDARNQLAAVNVGTHRSEFTYDGEQRRVRVVEKESGVIQSDTKVIWCGSESCEERAADGTTVTRRLFTDGEQVSNVARFFATDHLGSVTDVTDGGSVVLARHMFDPWGRSTVASGSSVTNVGFTGHIHHELSGLWFAYYRAYDAEFGRWTSRDPIGFEDGPNDYAYVDGNPVRYFDPYGLMTAKCVASCIEERRFDWETIGPLLFSRHWKRLLFIREVNPQQSGSTILSKVAGKMGGRRTHIGSMLRTTGRRLSYVATPIVVFEGFWDWTTIVKCLFDCRDDSCGN